MIKDISEEVNAKLVGVKPEYSTRFRVVNGTRKYREQYPGMKVTVKSYRDYTLHVLYVTQSFQDVRLVVRPSLLLQNLVERQITGCGLVMVVDFAF